MHMPHDGTLADMLADTLAETLPETLPAVGGAPGATTTAVPQASCTAAAARARPWALWPNPPTSNEGSDRQGGRRA